MRLPKRQPFHRVCAAELALLVLASAHDGHIQEPGEEPLLSNGAFELGEGAPTGWVQGDDPRAMFRWELAYGIGGTRCISIEVPGEGADVAWVQRLRLAPRTAYVLRGKVRGEGIQVTQEDGRVGANLCQMGVWGCSSDPEASQGTFDWTPFEVDFATGESGEVELGCRLGHWGSEAKGKAWFDDLELSEAPGFGRHESRNLYLLLPEEDGASIAPGSLTRFLGHLDDAYDAMAELTGIVPFGGSKIGIYPCTWDCGGYMVAGNPIYWMRWGVRDCLERVQRTDDWSFGHLHELGHDFDEDGDAYNFNGEFWANFKLYYAIETLGGRIVDGDQHYVGAGHLRYWKEAYDRDWRHPDPTRRHASHDGLLFVTILMRHEIGWEPFRRVFRYCHSLAPEERPGTPWQRFELFYDKLADYSGADVWGYFTPEDLLRLRSLHQGE